MDSFSLYSHERGPVLKMLLILIKIRFPFRRYGNLFFSRKKKRLLIYFLICCVNINGLQGPVPLEG